MRVLVAVALVDLMTTGDSDRITLRESAPLSEARDVSLMYDVESLASIARRFEGVVFDWDCLLYTSRCV